MLWFDRAGLDPDLYQSLAQAVAQPRPRVLAWAESPNGIVVALPDRLVVREGEAWRDTPWRDVISGGWDSRDGALTWTTASGGHDRVALTEPGTLPELFRERVTASIVLSEHVDVPGTPHGITLTARRNPAAPRSGLSWVPIAQPGTDLSNPEVARAVAQVVADIRANYDIG